MPEKYIIYGHNLATIFYHKLQYSITNKLLK